ncbi:Luciferase-like monooxygenase [mine drainage metagenome]|uniref:Luciferase-like monooxygenase n=1 Tax=mine drainage metagenome TaxID=410659 RepID=T1AB60_9ZZZZ
MGLGSGYVPAEFAGYGIDPATRHERFDRAYETIVRAMGGEPVEAGIAGAPPVRLNVRPVQRPHPPFWIAVQRREAIPFVARRGTSIALIPYATVADRAELAEEIREFRAAAQGPGQEVAVAVHVYAGPDPDHARAAFRRYLDDRLALGSTHLEAKAARAPHQVDPDALEAAGLAGFGSPSEVDARLAQLAEIGVDEVLGIFDFGGLPPTEAIASIEALGRLRREEP